MIYRAMDRLAQFSMGLIVILAITGGYIFSIDGKHVEIGQINAFALALGVLLYALAKRYPQSKSLAQVDRALAALSRIKNPSRMVLKIILGISLWLLLTRLVRHFSMNTHVFDLSCLHQPLFFPFSPNLLHCDACRNGTQFAEHILWPLMLITPITALFKSNVLVFVIEHLFMMIPLYFFIMRGPLRGHSWTLVPFTILTFLSSPLRQSLIGDFREDQMIFGFGLMMLASLFNGKFGWYWFFFALGLLSKENTAAVYIFLVIPLLFSSDLNLSTAKRRRMATVTAIVCVVYTIFVVKEVIPFFMKGIESQNNILLRIPGFGNTMGEFALNALKNPIPLFMLLIKATANLNALKYLLVVSAPFILLGSRAWLWTIPGWAGLFMNLIAAPTAPHQIMARFHYELIPLPFFIAAAALGLSRLIPASWQKFDRTHLLFATPLLFALFFVGRSPTLEITTRIREHGYRIPATLKLITIENLGPIAAQPYIWPHLSHLPHIRFLVVPSESPTRELASNARVFLDANPYRPISGQGRDLEDATEFLLELDTAWGAQLTEDIQLLGGELLRTFADWNGKPFLAHLRLSKPLLDVWCEKLEVCRESTRPE